MLATHDGGCVLLFNLFDTEGLCRMPRQPSVCDILESFNAALEQVTIIAAHTKGVPHNHGKSRFDGQWVPPLFVHAPKRA